MTAFSTLEISGQKDERSRNRNEWVMKRPARVRMDRWMRHDQKNAPGNRKEATGMAPSPTMSKPVL